jgi:hypothetical protein
MMQVECQDTERLTQRIQGWIEGWVNTNRYWTLGKTLDFFDDFAGLPVCRAGGANVICLRMECRAEAKKQWKDWLAVRLLKELMAAFAEVKSVDKITNCREVSESESRQ